METNKKTVVITGAMGFVGAHLVEAILKMTDWKIVTIDRLDVSGNPNRFSDIDIWDKEKSRVKVLFWDLKAAFNDMIKYDIGEFDYFLHVAAGSHVDRSIDDPMSFIMDNVVGTGNCLDFYRGYVKELRDYDEQAISYGGQKTLSPVPKFLYFSTDEVFGPAPEGVNYKEWDRFNPNNPYAAAKAGGESLCDAYANTYKLPILVTHCMNIFGERQHPEKYIPMVIKSVLKGHKVNIHADKTKTKAGTRFYIHARNVADAVLFLLQDAPTLDGHARKGRYNIVGEREVSNLDMAQLIEKYVHEWLADTNSLEATRPLNYELVDFHSSRPGHDLRYGLDGELLASMGFQYNMNFEESLRKMVRWTLDNPRWLML